MPSKKKKQITGLSMFIQDIKPQLQREGHNNKKMEELVQIAHPLWKNLSAEEREEYNDKAKEAKRKMRETGGVRSGGRLDNLGNLMSETANLDEMLKKQRQAERNVVRDSWHKGNAVCLEIFYIITFEALCKLPGKKGYLPAEVAVVEYSLSAGIIRTWHRFIDPGPIPMGFRFLCLSTSDDTHQIPIENFERAESDYRAIWTDMCNFINPDKKKSLPCLYTLYENVDKVDYCIDWLAYRAGTINRLQDKIYELEILAAELFSHNSDVLPTTTALNNVFTTSSFDYEANTRCDFHEELENKHCALGVAKIHCFVMSDALADIYDIELTGSHVPERADQSYSTYVNPTKYTQPPIRRKAPTKKQNGYDNVSEISTSPFASRDIRYKKTEQPEEEPLRRPKGRGIAGSITTQPPPGRSSSRASYNSHNADAETSSEPDLQALPDLDYAGHWRPGVQTPQPNFNVSDLNTDDWPSLGGPSASYKDQGAKPKKYANGKMAPPPSAVPQPAFSWKATGRGRGFVTTAGGPPNTQPGQSRNTAEEKTRQIQEMFRGTGRGRGVLAYHNN